LELMKNSEKTTAARYWHSNRALFALATVYSFALLGCHPDMWNQPRYKAQQKSTFFADGAADRPRVANTIRYDGARRPWVAPVYASLTGSDLVPGVTDGVFRTGLEEEGYRADNYFEVNLALLERGRERYNAVCSNCHGTGGYGNGLITQRGFPVPPSYHIDRLREVEDGYLVDVIVNGFGRMYSHASQVAAEDRWAIAAYIRALQYSQNVPLGDLSETDQQELEKARQAVTDAADHRVADTHAD